MPSYEYPPPAPTLDGSLTIQQVHYLLKNPNLLARRVRTLALNKYVADFLLPERYQVVGGAILYPSGEPLFPNDDPEVVEIGAEYPLTNIEAGTLALAKTVNWGRDAEVFDVSIARMLVNPVNRALLKLVNGNIKFVDSVALGVIASKITRTYAAGAAWTALTSGDQIVEDVLGAIAVTEELEDGFNIDTVVLKPTQFAKVRARLSAADLLPRETGNPIEAGARMFPYLGLNWVSSIHSPVSNPLLLDRLQLGGMADENIQSPGYTSAGGDGAAGIEVASWRLGGEANRDGYRMRVRRITVPVVLEPNAGVAITGTGI